MNQRTIAGLDAIRFAAACMVMWYHLAFYSWFGGDPTLGGRAAFPELAPTAMFGGVGVEIFFVLSGFVIPLTANGRTASQFATSRFLRLMPAAWLCATLTYLVLLFFSELSDLRLFSLYAKALVLWPLGDWIDGVYWTLTVEVSFYLTVFLLLLAGRFDRFGYLLVAIGTPGTVLIGAWLLGADISWVYRSHILSILLVKHGFLFALGGFVWMASNGRMKPLFWISAVVFFVVGASSIAASPILDPITAVSVWVVAVLAIMASVRWNDAVPQAPFIRTIGLATYPLYLIHGQVGAAIMRVSVDLGLSRYAALSLGIGLSIVMSLVVATIFEPRARDVLKRALSLRLPPAFHRGA